MASLKDEAKGVLTKYNPARVCILLHTLLAQLYTTNYAVSIPRHSTVHIPPTPPYILPHTPYSVHMYTSPLYSRLQAIQADDSSASIAAHADRRVWALLSDRCP